VLRRKPRMVTVVHYAFIYLFMMHYLWCFARYRSCSSVIREKLLLIYVVLVPLPWQIQTAYPARGIEYLKRGKCKAAGT